MNTMQNPRMQAQALKRMGRGPDTQLIHMTDSEIDALNGLSALVFKEPLEQIQRQVSQRLECLRDCSPRFLP